MGNNIPLSELGVAKGHTAVATQAAQGHIEPSGAADGIPPLVWDLLAVSNGAPLRDAHATVRDGISEAGRLRIRFYESDLAGRVAQCTSRATVVSEVIILVSSGNLGD